jgi:hypothetical protein
LEKVCIIVNKRGNSGKQKASDKTKEEMDVAAESEGK